MSCRLRWYLRRSIPRGRGAMRLRRAAPASSPLQRGSSRKAALSARTAAVQYPFPPSCASSCSAASASDSQAARAERPGAFAAARSCARKPSGFGWGRGGRATRRSMAGAMACSDTSISAAPRTPAVRVRSRDALRTSAMTAASGTRDACQESASWASAEESSRPRPRTLPSSCATVSMYSLAVKPGALPVAFLCARRVRQKRSSSRRGGVLALSLTMRQD